MGLDVVAEGSETARQTEQLRALCCECAQGYVYAEPLSAEAATAMLTDRLRGLREQA